MQQAPPARPFVRRLSRGMSLARVVNNSSLPATTLFYPQTLAAEIQSVSFLFCFKCTIVSKSTDEGLYVQLPIAHTSTSSPDMVSRSRDPTYQKRVTRLPCCKSRLHLISNNSAKTRLFINVAYLLGLLQASLISRFFLKEKNTSKYINSKYY